MKRVAVAAIVLALGAVVGCTKETSSGPNGGLAQPATAGTSAVQPPQGGTGVPVAGTMAPPAQPSSGGAGAGVEPTMTAGATGGVEMTAGTGGEPVAGMTGGTGGEPVAGMTAGEGGTGAPPATARPPCLKDKKELFIIGDSYIDWVSHTFPSDLAKLADAVGVWDTIPGRGGTMYAVGGTSLTTGEIPGQFDRAIAANPNAKFIVMDGGGNDILLNLLGQSCKASGSSTMQVCKDIVAETLKVSRELMMKAADKGITDTVYFFYPHVPPNTALGGPNPNEILDYALPMARATCEGAEEMSGGRSRCHFVDMIPVFEGHLEYFAPTDLHPNGMGSAAMAKEVWRVMQENCVAQPASSGCCEP